MGGYGYTLENSGRKDTATEQRRESDNSFSTTLITWSYDNLDRLTSEQYVQSDPWGAGSGNANYTTNYTYDLVGNWLTMTKGSETATYGYDSGGDDRLTSVTDNVAGNSSFQYDANGSMTQMTQMTTTTTYGYDLQNRLTSQTVNGTTTTFGYDPNGNRIEEQVGSNSPTWYLVDGNNPSGYAQVLQESTTLGGTPTTTYTIGQSVLAQTNSSGVSTYLLPDGRGSIRLTTDSNGIITGRYDYDALGNANNFNPTSALTKYLYDNQQYDSTLGQYYLRARYYVPTVGRFASADSYLSKPGELQNANLYVYAANNPLNAADPSGHELTGLLTAVGIGATIGTIVGGAAGFAYATLYQHLPVLSLATLKDTLIGAAGGGIIGALLGGGVYLAAATGTEGGIALLRSGVTQLLAKLALPHSRTAGLAIAGFAVGVVTGLVDPDPDLIAAGAASVFAVGGADVVTRGLMRNRDLLIKIFGAAGYQSARTILFRYVQSTTFFAIGFAVGFTAGYTVGYEIRVHLID